MNTPAHPPVFLIGAARSGTSLLYKSLCLHPDTAWISNWVGRYPGHPALSALNRLAAARPTARHSVWFGAGGSNAYVYGHSRRLRERLFPMPVEGESFFARWGAPAPALNVPLPSAAEIQALRKAVAAVIGRAGDRVFVSKRIGHNWRIPALEACFPNARFVEIMRDGRAVAYSLSKVDWWDDSELVWRNGTPRQCQEQGMDAWDLCAQNWVAELEAITRGFDAVAPERHLRIAYEDFVTAPLETLDTVAGFAGLDPDPGWKRGLAQLRFPDRNENWRIRLEPALVRRIEDIQGRHLEANGYAPTPAMASPARPEYGV
jgi:hypothetical protein